MTKTSLFKQSAKTLKPQLVLSGITNEILKKNPDLYFTINEKNPSDYCITSKPWNENADIPTKKGYFTDYLPLAICGGHYTINDIIYYIKNQLIEYFTEYSAAMS